VIETVVDNSEFDNDEIRFKTIGVEEISKVGNSFSPKCDK
jgi:hypothetical protein